MRKSLAYFFLTCSLVLVIGHSMLPHNHDRFQTENYQITERTDLSLADIIKITLSHNLGINHLEEYRSCEAFDFSETVYLAEIIDQNQMNISTGYFLDSQGFCANAVTLRAQREHLATSERGPPSLS